MTTLLCIWLQPLLAYAAADQQQPTLPRCLFQKAVVGLNRVHHVHFWMCSLLLFCELQSTVHSMLACTAIQSAIALIRWSLANLRGDCPPVQMRQKHLCLVPINLKPNMIAYMSCCWRHAQTD